MNEFIKTIADGILKGERRALAKGITLIESSLPEHQSQAMELLSLVSKKKTNSIRIGISGVPGAGKSTFIETFGLYMISQGKKIAVLAVDPSSPLTGGSILGDKTRMPELTMSESAFIRPSPSGGNLGGVTRKTREVTLLCEASGYDLILIETVGVGQSEIAVSEMTDFFLLILIAGAGDELQGIKKGIMEIADLILINKADNHNKTMATLARNEYRNALHYLAPRHDFWSTEVLTISALYKEGISDVWKMIESFVQKSKDQFALNRKRQDQKWLWSSFESLIHREIEILKKENPDIHKVQSSLEKEEITMREALQKIYQIYKSSASF